MVYFILFFFKLPVIIRQTPRVVVSMRLKWPRAKQVIYGENVPVT
jgi:hypothetical protein